jgi:Family of unknown function (DUF6452)
MKRNFRSLLYLFFATMVLVGCESDDICEKLTTPQLIIRFYDNDDPTMLKKVPDLTVSSGDRGNLISDEETDSIAIPLNLTQNLTIFIFSSNDMKEEIIISYDKNDVFVSRSCGFKTTYENTAITTNNGWILNTEIIKSTVEDEASAHIKIFH